MKTFLTKKYIISGSILFLFLGCLFYLFFDGFYDTNFRTMQDQVPELKNVDVTGLRELRASGGTSVSFADLKKRLAYIEGPKIIIDGIKEFHGYVNGVPTTLLGYHTTKLSVRHLPRRLLITGTIEKRPELVISEQAEAQKYGFEYKNIKIGSKSFPSDKNVGEILSIFDNLPPNAWLHFHCHHGTGRTSVLLVMFDIMKNAPNVALSDIVKRQHLLGSTDLFNTEKWRYGTYTQEQLENRKKFIEQFYSFVVQRKAGGIQQWSDWKAQQKSNEDIS